MKKIKTFEDACKALKLDPKKLPKVIGLPALHKKSIIAYYKLVIIAQALNEGWKPNWSDGMELKYYPWFWFNKAGSGFSHYDYVGSGASASVGSRLCYKSSEIAEYAGKQFKNLYEEYHLLSK